MSQKEPGNLTVGRVQVPAVSDQDLSRIINEASRIKLLTEIITTAIRGNNRVRAEEGLVHINQCADTLLLLAQKV